MFLLGVHCLLVVDVCVPFFVGFVLWLCVRVVLCGVDSGGDKSVCVCVFTCVSVVCVCVCVQWVFVRVCVQRMFRCTTHPTCTAQSV